jgi:hypothetical protein
LDKYLLLDIRGLKDGEIHMIEMGKDELNTLPIGKNKSLSAEKFYEIYDSIK